MGTPLSFQASGMPLERMLENLAAFVREIQSIGGIEAECIVELRVGRLSSSLPIAASTESSAPAVSSMSNGEAPMRTKGRSAPDQATGEAASSATISAPTATRYTMSNEELRQMTIARLQELAAAGEQPNQKAWDSGARGACPTAASLRSRGMLWNDLLAEAGLEPRESFRERKRKESGSAAPADPGFWASNSDGDA